MESSREKGSSGGVVKGVSVAGKWRWAGEDRHEQGGAERDREEQKGTETSRKGQRQAEKNRRSRGEIDTLKSLRFVQNTAELNLSLFNISWGNIMSKMKQIISEIRQIQAKNSAHISFFWYSQLSLVELGVSDFAQ